MYFQIAIDGPGGVGKSTVAELLSKKLNYLYINTGIIFRGLAWYISKYEDLDVQEALTNIIKHKNFIFKKNKWFFNGKEVDMVVLKSKRITEVSSKIAQIQEVRDYILTIEREVSEKENVVMEGRDIGTVIFPNAILKIFLTGKAITRARRRYLELESKGILNGRTLEDIKKEIEMRDEADSTRELSPLKKADDAIEIFSDDKTPEEIALEIERQLNIKLSLL